MVLTSVAIQNPIGRTFKPSNSKTILLDTKTSSHVYNKRIGINCKAQHYMRLVNSSFLRFLHRTNVHIISTVKWGYIGHRGYIGQKHKKTFAWKSTCYLFLDVQSSLCLSSKRWIPVQNKPKKFFTCLFLEYQRHRFCKHAKIVNKVCCENFYQEL